MDAPLDPQRRVKREEEANYNYPYPPDYPTPGVQGQPTRQTVDSQNSYSQSGEARVENVQQTYLDPSGNVVEKQEHVLNDPYQRRLNVLNRVTQIIYFLFGLLEVLLAMRVIFRLISAETTAGFVNFIYSVTGPFIMPFNGIFNDQTLSRVGVLELSTLVAMLIYALLLYGIVRLLHVLFAPDRSSKEVYSKTRTSRR